MSQPDRREYRNIYCAGLNTTIAFTPDIWAQIEKVATQHQMQATHWIEWKLARYPYNQTRTQYIREQIKNA